MAIGYSLRMCARYVDSTNPGRSNLVFRSKPEAEMSNRLILRAPAITLSDHRAVVYMMLNADVRKEEGVGHMRTPADRG